MSFLTNTTNQFVGFFLGSLIVWCRLIQTRSGWPVLGLRAPYRFSTPQNTGIVVACTPTTLLRNAVSVRNCPPFTYGSTS